MGPDFLRPFSYWDLELTILSTPVLRRGRSLLGEGGGLVLRSAASSGEGLCVPQSTCDASFFGFTHLHGCRPLNRGDLFKGLQVSFWSVYVHASCTLRQQRPSSATVLTVASLFCMTKVELLVWVIITMAIAPVSKGANKLNPARSFTSVREGGLAFNVNL